MYSGFALINDEDNIFIDDISFINYHLIIYFIIN